MTKVEINSFNDLLEYIKSLDNEDDYWFRGQSNSEWLLLSGSERENIAIDKRLNGHQPFHIKSVNVREFYSLRKDKYYVFQNGALYFDAFETNLGKDESFSWKDQNAFYKKSIAQHYGLKTDLLDWTTDGILAFYFAICEIKDSNYCSLFVLKPTVMNNLLNGYNGIYNIDQLAKYKISNRAFKSGNPIQRISRQSGCFTTRGDMPLDLMDNNDSFLTKLIISREVAKSSLNILERLGYKINNILPNLEDSIIQDLCDKSNKDAEKRIEKLKERLYILPSRTIRKYCEAFDNNNLNGIRGI